MSTIAHGILISGCYANILCLIHLIPSLFSFSGNIISFFFFVIWIKYPFSQGSSPWGWGAQGMWKWLLLLLLLLLLSRFSRVWLCDPIDGSSPGSPVPGILQARALEWAAISFSNAWKWKVTVKSLSRVWLCVTPWTSMGFSRQEHWSGCHCLLRVKVSASFKNILIDFYVRVLML